MKTLVNDLYEVLYPQNGEFEKIKWDSLLIKEFQDESIAMLREMLPNMILNLIKRQEIEAKLSKQEKLVKKRQELIKLSWQENKTEGIMEEEMSMEDLALYEEINNAMVKLGVDNMKE